MPNDAPYRDGLPQAKPQRPPSATNFGLNSIALVIVLATILLLRTRTKPFGDEVLVLCGAVAIPVVAMDIFILKVHRRASTGLNWDQTFAPDFGRVLTKLHHGERGGHTAPYFRLGHANRPPHNRC